MTISPISGATPRHQFLAFIILSGVSGVIAGMLKVLTAIYAIRLGAGAVQIGIVTSLESFSMAAMTLPAGILVARFGARPVYVAGSIAITTIYSLAPLTRSWHGLAVAVGLGGLCMSFRMVSLNGSFLEQLRNFGQEKAGWYRGASIVGMLLAGPGLATLLLETGGVGPGYWTVAFLFGVMGLIGAFRLPSVAQRPERRISIGQSILGMTRLARHTLVAQICVIELSSGLVLAFFTSFIVLVGIQKVGLSEPVAVSVRFAEGIVSVCTMVLAGGFLNRQAPLQIYRTGVLLMVSGLLLLGLARNYVVLVLAAALLGVGFGMTQLVNVQQLSRADVEKGKVASLQLLSSMGGGFVGSALGGFLAKGLGFSGMFFTGAAIYALLSLRWCFARREPGAVAALDPAPAE